MKKTLAIMLALIMVVCLVPTVAFAEGKTITVGNTAGANYTTLAAAVAAAESGDTIVLTSDLTMTECARFYDKDLIIDGQGHTVTRGDEDDFKTLTDTARGSYNPAMIEVQTSGSSASLTLTNIILDDGGKHVGTVFAQAISGEGHGDNTVYVQDAIVASNATEDCTITLGEGAVLRNFGGMSAVRVTNKAKLVMKSGSVIEDNPVSKRTKGSAAGEVGPAGAVWIQSAAFEMEDGAKIQNVDGRAVYADGGEATIGGTISGITGNSNMWQGTNGSAIHLRNNATGTLTATGLIENVTGSDGKIVYLNSSAYAMEDGSIINNHANESASSKTHGIYSVDSKDDLRNEVRINGEICGINGNPLQIANTNVYIGKTGNIHNNFVNYGALYLQKNATANISGKINNNTASGRGGGIGTAGHGFVEINMYPGAEIKNNTAASTGGGASLKNCKFTMYGGEISGNTGKTGGGIYLYSDASADILGGTITNNTSEIGPNDLAVTSSNWGTDSIYLYISDEAQIGNPAVYMEQNTKTVSPGDRNIKLHNASGKEGDSIDALKKASNDKGWNAPIATFWTQRDGAASLTVGGLKQLENNLPVYVLTQKTGADGKPTSPDAPVHTYAATVDDDGNVKFTLPSGDMNGNGCAVAIVQPKKDYGTLTINGPETIQQNTTGEDYPVTYTVTYTMSESMKSIIAQPGSTATYSLTINKDTRLTGTPGSTFNGRSIDVTYTLPNGNFTEGESLFASAELTITVGNARYTVPSNVAKTIMIGSGSTGGDSTGGDSTGGGHYHPDPTPVPVIVIPPKTGDMTLWQSILHFFGIR